MKKICVLMSILFMALISVNTVKADETEIQNMTIQVEINQQGNAAITETWNMSVYEGTEVYKVLDNMDESVVSRLRVTDDTGFVYEYVDDWDVDWDFEEKAGQCGIIQDGDRYELCFGIGEYGQRTYTFQYEVSNFVKQYDDLQGFNYAFFSEMELDIDHFLITVSSPYDFDDDNSQIWAFGYSGKVYFQDGNVILENDQPLTDGEKVQLLMSINTSPFINTFENKGDFQQILDDALDNSQYDETQYQQDGYYMAFPYKSYEELIFFIVLGVLAVIGIGVVLTISYQKAVKNLTQYRFDDYHPFFDSYQTYRSIPCQGDIFQIYYLAIKAKTINESQKEGLIEALFMKWIQQQKIRLEQDDVFIIEEAQGINHPLERQFYGYLVEAAENKKELKTKQFEKWCSRHHNELQDWFESVKTYVEDTYLEAHLIEMEDCQGKWLCKQIKGERQVLSSALREDMLRIAGLKHYLEDFQEDELNQKEEYMIYASLLGVYEEFDKKLHSLYPNSYMNSYWYYSAGVIHTMSHQSMNSMNSSVTGGGSSFSGGGGGGVR